MLKVYISGPITGTDDYMERFTKAEYDLRRKGYEVINPAAVNQNLPASTTWEQYMEMSLCMLKMCNSIYMLKGWRKSAGAALEYCEAKGKDYEIMEEMTETQEVTEDEKMRKEKDREYRRQREMRKFKQYFSHIQRKGSDMLWNWLEVSGFFTAPASTKYHGSYSGGLLRHSNNVYQRLLELTMKEEKKGRKAEKHYHLETIALVALLHDVCKMDLYKQKESGQQDEDEKPQYTYKNDFPIGHGEKSVIQIMRFISLTDEEIMAIRWHMGGFDDAVRGGSRDMNNAFGKSKLAVMLHLADMMATYLDEREA